MMTIEKRLARLEKKRQSSSRPVPETALDHQLLARLDSGRDRARAAYDARGLPLASDDEPLLPPMPAGSFDGMTTDQIRIHILHRGRQRNYLRWFAEHKREAQ